MKHRIVKRDNWFYVQRKTFLFFWVKIEDSFYRNGFVSFKSERKAKQYIAREFGDDTVS